MECSLFSIQNCDCLAAATFVHDCPCNPLFPLSQILEACLKIIGVLS